MSSSVISTAFHQGKVAFNSEELLVSCHADADAAADSVVFPIYIAFSVLLACSTK